MKKLKYILFLIPLLFLMISNVFADSNPNLYKGLSISKTDSTYWNSVSAGFTPLEDGWGKFSYNNTNGSSTIYVNAKIQPSAISLKVNTTYTMVVEIRNSTISESGNAFLQLVSSNAGTASQEALSLGYTQINNGGVYKKTFTTKQSFSNVTSPIDTYLRLASGTSGTVEVRLSIYEGDVSIDNFVYVPFGVDFYIEDPIIEEPEELQGLFSEMSVKLIGELPETLYWLYDLTTILLFLSAIGVILIPILIIFRKFRS